MVKNKSEWRIHAFQRYRHIHSSEENRTHKSFQHKIFNMNNVRNGTSKAILSSFGLSLFIPRLFSSLAFSACILCDRFEFSSSFVILFSLKTTVAILLPPPSFRGNPHSLLPSVLVPCLELHFITFRNCHSMIYIHPVENNAVRRRLLQHRSWLNLVKWERWSNECK